MGTLTGNSTWWESFAAPDDGDLRNALNILAALGALADRTVYLRDRLRVVCGVKTESWESGVHVNNLTPTAWTESEADGIYASVACADGDILLANVVTNVRGVWSDAGIRLYYKQAYGTGSESKGTFAGTTMTFTAHATSTSRVVALQGQHQVSLAGTVRVGIETRLGAGSTEINLVDGLTIRLMRLRGFTAI